MNSNLIKRIITSFFLISLLFLMFYFTYILIISLIIVATVTWIEFNRLINKIFSKIIFKNKILKFFYKLLSLFYLFSLVSLILYIEANTPELRVIIFYSILISVMSDIGGLVVGKIFRGKKLTKISPNKTISGSIGSIVFSLFLVPLFIDALNYELLNLIFVTILISIISQTGDIFISFLKRRAKVKDTSNILPGHGGLLDRIDGIIFAIPMGFFLLSYF